MNEQNKDTKVSATEANVQPIAAEEVKVPAVEVDYEEKVKALEDEKAKLIKDASNQVNYKEAYLKLKKKKGIENEEELVDDDERLREIAREEMRNSRLAEITREQDLIIKKALQENKELKLANLNKSTATPPAGTAVHSESKPVQSTSITPDQMAYFKSKGWSDKEIERYKQNLQKNNR